MSGYTYTGREWDKETGLYYYRARYYDPMEGRFISKDPIGFNGGDINLYGYVLNNPIKYIDPSGNGRIGWIVMLVKDGLRKIASIDTIEEAVSARKAGKNVLARNKQTARQIEEKAFPNGDQLKHKGHDLELEGVRHRLMSVAPAPAAALGCSPLTPFAKLPRLCK